MAKLPPTFVKAPPAESADKPKRSRKTSLVAEVVRDVREIVLRLDDAEHRALEEARTALVRAGEQVTIEQIVHRVLGDWLRARTAPAPAPAAPASASAPPLDAMIRDRLRAFAAAPLRTWRELGAALRRWVPAR